MYTSTTIFWVFVIFTAQTLTAPQQNKQSQESETENNSDNCRNCLKLLKTVDMCLSLLITCYTEQHLRTSQCVEDISMSGGKCSHTVGGGDKLWLLNFDKNPRGILAMTFQDVGGLSLNCNCIVVMQSESCPALRVRNMNLPITQCEYGASSPQ